MAAVPLAPPVFKGALATLPALGATGAVVVFQYNPASLTRTLAARMTGGERAASVPRFAGPPEETIKLALEIDATDQLEVGDATAAELGILPALAALEAMIYPPSPVVVANEVLARMGMVEIIPMEAPLTVLVWGPRRILPVAVTELSVTEDAFDTALNPVLAKVDLSLKVRSYTDLGLASRGGALSLAHHIATEVLGARSRAASGATFGALTGNGV